MTEFVPAQTSVPDWLMTYCRQLSDVHHSRKLNRMYLIMLEGFLANKPWEAYPPYGWKVANSHGSSMAKVRKRTEYGWVPMNMVLPIALVNQIKTTIELINMNNPEDTKVLSLRTFLYTAVCWWCEHVYPYKGPGIIGS